MRILKKNNNGRKLKKERFVDFGGDSDLIWFRDESNEALTYLWKEPFAFDLKCVAFQVIVSTGYTDTKTKQCVAEIWNAGRNCWISSACPLEREIELNLQVSRWPSNWNVVSVPLPTELVSPLEYLHFLFLLKSIPTLWKENPLQKHISNSEHCSFWQFSLQLLWIDFMLKKMELALIIFRCDYHVYPTVHSLVKNLEHSGHLDFRDPHLVLYITRN